MNLSSRTLLCLTLLLAGPGETVATAPDQLTLSQAVEIAQHNNPTTKRSLEEITGARFASQSAKSGFLPTLSAHYTITSVTDTIYQVQNGRQVQVAPDNQYNWGLTLVQPLFTGFAVTSQNEMAKIGVKVSEKEQQQSLLDVTKGVKSAYYRVLLAEKISLVAKEAVTTLGAHEQDANRFYEHGIIRQNDLLRAKVAHANALQQQERANADTHIARADLNRWLARDLNDDIRLAPIDTIPQVQVDLPALLAVGLQERPQLQAMELVRKTMDEAVTLAQSSAYPSVSLVGRYWHNGDAPAANNNDFENDHNAMVLLQASWTLYDGGKTGADVGKAISAKKAYEESIRQARDGIGLEIKSAYLNLGVARQNLQTAKLSLTQAEENMRITQLAYRQEAATSTEVLDAQTDLTGARTNYFQALYGYLDALAALEHAAGHELATPPDLEKPIKTAQRAEVLHGKK